MILTQREINAFSLRNVIRANGEPSANSFEGEVIQELKTESGMIGLPGVPIPWQVLSRHRRVMDHSQLSTTAHGEPLGALRSGTLLGKLGAAIHQAGALDEDYIVPSVSNGVTAEWLTAGNGVNASTPTIGAGYAVAKTASVLLRASRLVMNSGNDEFIERLLFDSIAKLIDEAFIAGSGSEGAPCGLMSGSLIQSVDMDAVDTYGDIASIEQAIEDADSAVTAWALSPAMKRRLRLMDKAGNVGNFILSHNTIDGTPAVADSAVPADAFIAGRWADAGIVVFGNPVLMRDDLHENFASGASSLRLYVKLDTVCARPASFRIGRWV